ncbi:chorismate mutase [Synergistales bacterium]|nr:chorismate mutase [Synergistales bacterium]
MSGMDQIKELRERIDDIDRRLVETFKERMDVSFRIAKVKVNDNMPLEDARREKIIVDKAVSQAGDELRSETSLLMRSILAISKEYQRGRTLSAPQPLLPPARERRRENVTCAFQGVPGAWSEQALIKLFPGASRRAVEFFEDVFTAVKEKKADYGLVPIENSYTGAIGETYDLLRKYGCFIVGRTWIDIRQCLLAAAGTSLSDIREVLSHPEGFKQCRRFLHDRSWDLTACRNTAVAAERAAKASGGRIAAIGSRRAAELNGLEVIAPDIMDSAGNRTSFVVIASEPEYDGNSGLISLTFSTAHRAGALCETLMPFMAQGVNLMRLESRPASAPDKYRFFAEVSGSVTNKDVVLALRQAAATCEYFEVIGCYSNT